MQKLELLYHCCTASLIADLERFYAGTNFPKDKLFIDSDNLQGMLIYIVSKLKYRQLWTEISLLDDFVPQSVMMSNRAFYMILIKASCEYLINLKEAPPTPKPTPQEQ